VVNFVPSRNGHSQQLFLESAHRHWFGRQCHPTNNGHNSLEELQKKTGLWINHQKYSIEKLPISLWFTQGKRENQCFLNSNHFPGFIYTAVKGEVK
jgi:hypothetical protein